MGGESYIIFPDFSRPSWTKISEISINAVANINEVEQISLLFTCITKLHRYCRVTLHFFGFSPKNFLKILPSSTFINPPFIIVRVNNNLIHELWQWIFNYMHPWYIFAMDAHIKWQKNTSQWCMAWQYS